MRKKSKKQMPLMPPEIDHPQAEELSAINRILDSNPIIGDLVMQDLSPERIKSKAGAKGMTAEQVIRAAIVKQMFEFSYKDLAFHLVDSVRLAIKDSKSRYLLKTSRQFRLKPGKQSINALCTMPKTTVLKRAARCALILQ